MNLILWLRDNDINFEAVFDAELDQRPENVHKIYFFDSFGGPSNVTSKLCSLCFNLLINLTCSCLICLSNMMKIRSK